MDDGKGKRYSTLYSNFDQLLINVQWRHGKGIEVLNDLNPYNGNILVEIPHANRDEMDEADRGAAKTQPEWAALLPGERGAIMRRAAQIMETRHEEIVSWIIHESGGTRIKANLEWTAVHSVLLEATTLPYLVEGRILPADIPGKESRIYRKPVGVVGVVKPASDTPLTGGLLLAKILEEAGLPADLLSIIVSAGSQIGDAFVTHPIPRVISFIGSIPVGCNIAKLAAEGPMLKQLELELGGNGPFVVLSDADLGQVVEAAVFGKFLHQSQTCMSINRFTIDVRIHDEFVKRFADRVRQLK